MDELISKWLTTESPPKDLTNLNKIISGIFLLGSNTSDPDAGIIDVFKIPKNHVDATSSIIQFCANGTSFHPGAQSPSISATHFDNFMMRVSTFPGFGTMSIDNIPISLSGSLSQLKEEVMSKYLPNNRDEVERAIQRQVSGFLIHSHSKSDKYLFFHISIKNDDSKVTFSVARMIISISHDNNDMAFIEEQSTILSIVLFSVISSILISNAENLAETISKTPLDKLITDITSPYNCR